MHGKSLNRKNKKKQLECEMCNGTQTALKKILEVSS